MQYYSNSVRKWRESQMYVVDVNLNKHKTNPYSQCTARWLIANIKIFAFGIKWLYLNIERLGRSSMNKQWFLYYTLVINLVQYGIKCIEFIFTLHLFFYVVTNQADMGIMGSIYVGTITVTLKEKKYKKICILDMCYCIGMCNVHSV